MHEDGAVTWLAVAQATDLSPESACVVRAAGLELALIRTPEGFFALDNACPHRGGPLGEGDLEGCVLTCPWHAWRWDVTSGANVNNPALRLACFPVWVEGQGIFVDLP